MNAQAAPFQPKEVEVPQWRKTALSHREHQLTLIKPEWCIESGTKPPRFETRSIVTFVESQLSPEELKVTSLNTTLPQLQSWVSSKRYTATQITSAYCHRAALLQQTTSCLTEILFSSALETARQQDAHYQSTGTLQGPLHGIPISLKDNQDIAGVDSTLGWVGLINTPALSSTPLVETLIKAGAIIYCKTNIPQSLMMSDSYNHLYGQSVNPLNTHLISGGSSGGEGALISGGGSILGIGTDIGGSIRIPATLQGLYGLSPSIGRVGNKESIRRDKYVVPPVAGPLARDIDSLDTFMSIYLSQQPWKSDPAILPIPWRQDIINEFSNPAKKLKIGYVTDDGVIRCQPPIVRAVEHTVTKLRAAGHEIIDWNPIARAHHSQAYNLWLRAVLADGGSRFHALSSLTSPPEPLIQGMLVGRSENKLDTEGRMGLFDEIVEFQKLYMKIWEEAGVDALIMPVTQYTALKPKMWVQADMYVGYTSLTNLLNWTSLVVPSIRVDRELDAVSEEWKGYVGRTFSDRYNHGRYEELLDERQLEGMPVGVQIVTGRLEEERAVGIARMLAGLGDQ